MNEIVITSEAGGYDIACASTNKKHRVMLHDTAHAVAAEWSFYFRDENDQSAPIRCTVCASASVIGNPNITRVEDYS